MTKEDFRTLESQVAAAENKIAERIQRGIVLLLDKGWTIDPTSCHCGGGFAWSQPTGVMFGCVCHKTLKAIESLTCTI